MHRYIICTKQLTWCLSIITSSATCSAAASEARSSVVDRGCAEAFSAFSAAASRILEIYNKFKIGGERGGEVAVTICHALVTPRTLAS